MFFESVFGRELIRPMSCATHIIFEMKRRERSEVKHMKCIVRHGGHWHKAGKQSIRPEQEDTGSNSDLMFR